MTVSWKTTQAQSQDAAINSAKALFDSTKLTTGNATLTAAEFINGLCINSTGAATLTSPTAAQIVAAIKNCAIGSHFFFGVVATDANAVTMAAGTGVQSGTWGAGFDVVAANTGQLFMGVVTAIAGGSEAVRVVNVNGAA